MLKTVPSMLRNEKEKNTTNITTTRRSFHTIIMAAYFRYEIEMHVTMANLDKFHDKSKCPENFNENFAKVFFFFHHQLYYRKILISFYFNVTFLIRARS